jgi:H+-translocating NAD(P) transhydrogenase subunit beta
MDFGFTMAAYAVATVLFVLSLGGLSNQEKAKRAVWYGIVGMAVAVLATMVGPGSGLWGLSLILIALGGVVGWQLATRVQMTQMPELVAIMHSLVGLAAVFVGFNAHLEIGRVAADFAAATLPFPQPEGPMSSAAYQLWLGMTDFAMIIGKKTAVEVTILRIELMLGIWIGAVTFTGSVVAYGKLAGRIGSAPVQLPGGHILNALAAGLSVLFAVLYIVWANSPAGSVFALIVLTALALFIGYHLIMGIGGADMPVVVSMLNSYSGWAAAAIGFSLGNELLIVVGALVGSSGAILSYIMCKAMNRSFVNVILGGFGGTTGPAADIEGEMIEIDAGGVAAALNDGFGHHRPGLRHGRGTGAGRGQRPDPQVARKGEDGALWHPPGRWPPAGAHERAAGRGQGAL